MDKEQKDRFNSKAKQYFNSLLTGENAADLLTSMSILSQAVKRKEDELIVLTTQVICGVVDFMEAKHGQHFAVIENWEGK